MDASADIDALMQESKQGTVIIETVFCGDALVRGGSSASNLLEPSRTTSLQSYKGVWSSFT